MLFRRRRAAIAEPMRSEPSVEAKSGRIIISYHESWGMVCHVLTPMQMSLLEGILRQQGLPTTLELMRKVVALSSLPQLCFLPRAPQLCTWAFEEGVKAFFEQELKGMGHRLVEEL